jgi:hypothetical protein
VQRGAWPQQAPDTIQGDLDIQSPRKRDWMSAVDRAELMDRAVHSTVIDPMDERAQEGLRS